MGAFTGWRPISPPRWCKVHFEHEGGAVEHGPLYPRSSVAGGLDSAIVLFPSTRNFTPGTLSPHGCLNGYRRHTAGGNPTTIHTSNILKYPQLLRATKSYPKEPIICSKIVIGRSIHLSISGCGEIITGRRNSPLGTCKARIWTYLYQNALYKT